MNRLSLSALTLLVLANFAATPFAKADDKQKKLLQYQHEQQQKLQEWKVEETRRQQQSQQQQDAARRRRVAAVARPWAVNQAGRGSFAFSNQRPDRLNFATVTLGNFYGANGSVSGGGPAEVTLNGTYGYPMHGTWALRGDFTVSLSLVPANRTLRGDRIGGNLTMTPPNGASVSSITLSGVMGGNPFTANFSGR